MEDEMVEDLLLQLDEGLADFDQVSPYFFSSTENGIVLFQVEEILLIQVFNTNDIYDLK